MGTTEPFQMRDGWILEDTMVDTYAEIAEEAFAQFLSEKASPLIRPELEHDAAAYHEHEKRKKMMGIKTIVFSAMTLEAAAYEFATLQLGEHFAKKYLDKLDVVGKWLVIPRLVCGRSLREDGPAINGLKALIKSRNALVHHKSKEWDSRIKASDTLNAIKEQRAQFENVQVPNAFKTLILLSLELNAVLQAEGPLPSFENSWIHATPCDPLVAQVIHRCREVHRDNWRGL